jgi:hypothetical protein
MKVDFQEPGGIALEINLQLQQRLIRIEWSNHINSEKEGGSRKG